ncbi:MAG: TetR/AcrR family transcriptional regulator [candidate division Zixibacteria bacterium]|nr:TetR/AcrR family transcriptional regulator [candidate division Zixibacteria bacterium]MDH3937463.1 TetR/AcrR family transcriptional regulator [candidate division Zixibacteria bacterium]MDH4032526.1 TetR/AcrR family transcriptional regulator [candidate division Zixibacteria bacterium]
MLDENITANLAQRGIVTETFRRLTPDKKELIYRAAIDLFGKFGYDGLAVDQLCREAAISKGSFFQYFPSKSHLLEYVVLMFDDFLTKWMADLKQAEKAVLARERLLYLYDAIVVNSKLYPAQERFFLFVTRGLEHAAVRLEGIDLERHFNGYIAQIIQRGEQTGEIRGDFDVELTARLTSLLIEGLIRRRFRAGRLPRRETGEYLISFLFDGIKA